MEAEPSVTGAAALGPVVVVCPRPGIAASDTASASKRTKLALCAFMISSCDPLYLFADSNPNSRTAHTFNSSRANQPGVEFRAARSFLATGRTTSGRVLSGHLFKIRALGGRIRRARKGLA